MKKTILGLVVGIVLAGIVYIGVGMQISTAAKPDAPIIKFEGQQWTRDSLRKEILRYHHVGFSAKALRETLERSGAQLVTKFTSNGDLDAKMKELENYTGRDLHHDDTTTTYLYRYRAARERMPLHNSGPAAFNTVVVVNLLDKIVNVGCYGNGFSDN